jgi:hypothetical protein
MTTYHNERGNTETTAYVGDRGRYHYDLSECRSEDGWHQYHTTEDAHYFGVWVHPERREILTYAEGDEIRTTCPTSETYRAELDHMAQFYGPPPPAFSTLDDDGTVTTYTQGRD